MRVSKIIARTDRLLEGITTLKECTYYGTAVGTILSTRTDPDPASSRRREEAINRLMTGYYDPRPLWM